VKVRLRDNALFLATFLNSLLQRNKKVKKESHKLTSTLLKHRTSQYTVFNNSTACSDRLLILNLQKRKPDICLIIFMSDYIKVLFGSLSHVCVEKYYLFAM
jgi:hypothetical protein